MKFEIIEENNLVKYEHEQTDLQIQAKEIEVTSQGTYHIAEIMIQQCRDLESKISEVLDPDIKRFHGLHKEALAKKKQFTDPLKDIEEKLKAKMKAFYNAEQKRQQEEQLRLYQEAEAKRKELEGHGIEIDVPAEIAESFDKGKTQFQSKWRFTIIDEKAIPREYLLVDESKIRKVVDALKGEARIPGIQVYEDKIVKVGR
jgi:hypothetical protein